jgi:23S rRNA pseudouridine955/2504/2580 synthase
MSGGVETRAVAEDESEERVDRWFNRNFLGLSHGRLEKLLRTGQIRVDGKRAKASQRLEVGQAIRIPPLDAETVRAPEAKKPKPSGLQMEADDPVVRQLLESILHMDDEMIVINKPAGLAVQGGSGTKVHVDAALDHLKFDKIDRPRLVHRLDKDTSGALVLARSQAAARRLTQAFRHKATLKIYWALVVGEPKMSSGEIDAPLQKRPGRLGEKMEIDDEGKRAVTRYRIIERLGGKVTWVAMYPVTGRTHQLRVHMSEIDCPILGDGKYGGQEAFLHGEGVSRKLHLHARALRLPGINGKTIEVIAPLTDHIKRSWSFFDLSESSGKDPFGDFED